jgi:DNA-binding IclR family transcriptional regulator
VDTASGHALLAFQSPARRAQMLAEHETLEGEVALAEDELERLLARVRAQGYWQGESQQAYGVIDISMPILGPQGDAMAVLTCPFIRRVDRHVGASVDEAREQLQAAARQLSLA